MNSILEGDDIDVLRYIMKILLITELATKSDITQNKEKNACQNRFLCENRPFDLILSSFLLLPHACLW